MELNLSESDREYYEALKRARIAVVSGAQSYRIGSRSVTKADLKYINDELARLEGSQTMRVRRVVPIG